VNAAATRSRAASETTAHHAGAKRSAAPDCFVHEKTIRAAAAPWPGLNATDVDVPSQIAVEFPHPPSLSESCFHD
jgi:hypothetical protein